MNWLQLKTRAAQTVGMARSGADGNEEWVIVGEVANEAVIDILSRTRVNVRGVTITLNDGESDYEIADAILRMIALRRADDSPLQEIDPSDLERYSDSDVFAVLGYNRIAFGFTPSSDDLTLLAWYVPLPTPMTDDAHDPSGATYGGIPVEFHPAILNFMCWKLADIAKDQGSGRGERYRVLYEGQNGTGSVGSDLGKIKAATLTRGGSGSRLGRIRRGGEILYGDSSPTRWQG